MCRTSGNAVDYRRIYLSGLALILAAPVLLSAWSTEAVEHRRRYEASDIAKLAAITRADHSTVFFHGFTASGYVRNGTVHDVVLRVVKEPLHLQCRGEAVSRD